MNGDNILLVDGSELSRRLITRHLHDIFPDVNIMAAGSKQDAVKLLKGNQFSLITTALMLPDADGLNLCRYVRDTKRHHFTPVIVISSDADERLRREGYAAGVTDYFDKSRGYQELGHLIKEFRLSHIPLYGRVLYIEDSRTIAALTKHLLEQHGLSVHHLTSAEEALDLLGQANRQQGGCYDLVITDFYLDGDMTGGDLLYVLRTRQRYGQQELPVLVITGNDDIATQVELFRAGANDFVNKPLVEEVFMARIRSLLLIKHQFDTLQRQAVDMRQLASTDVLTGVHNRRHLFDEGQAFLEQKPAGWAVIVDLDHFKKVNDRFGHLIGDKVLMAMGEALKRLFQDGLSARFGGEEFIILLHGEDVPQRTENLRKEVESLCPAGVEVTISLGLAASNEHPNKDLNTLIGLADEALYRAKQEGRNRACIRLADGRFSLVGQ